MASVLNTFVTAFTSRLEPPVRQHLKNVYGCLSLATLAASVGACVQMYTQMMQLRFLTMIGTLGLLFALMSTPDNGKNQKLRLSYLLGFAFLSGLGLGPLLTLAIHVEPSIVVTALIGTTLVFVSFSISALLAERGRYLYLGGILFSLVNIMVIFSFVNIFLRYSLFYQAHLYVELFTMCGFVIYDTQLIIEKFHMGSKDFIAHSFDLFIDFISIFRHIVEILTRKELAREQRKRKE